MPTTETTRPLVDTSGLVPRYVRDRRARLIVERAASAASALASPQPPVSRHLLYSLGNVDDATTALRDRVIDASPSPPRSPLAMTASVIAGLTVVLLLLASAHANGMTMGL